MRPRRAGSSGAVSRARAAASARASRALPSSVPGASPDDGPAGRGHGRGQVTGALRVGTAEHRPPPCRIAVALGLEHGQHPAAGGQAGREPRHRGQVGQRPAGHGRVAGRAGAAPAGFTQQRQRGGGAEGEHGHPPARQRHPAAPGRNRSCRSHRPSGCLGSSRSLRADEFRRGQRAAAGRRQPQGQLVVDGLADRVARRRAGRPGGPAEDASRSASSAAWQANGCGRAGARPEAPPRAAAAGPGPRPTGRALSRAPRPRGLPAFVPCSRSRLRPR